MNRHGKEFISIEEFILKVAFSTSFVVMVEACEVRHNAFNLV